MSGVDSFFEDKKRVGDGKINEDTKKEIGLVKEDEGHVRLFGMAVEGWNVGHRHSINVGRMCGQLTGGLILTEVVFLQGTSGIYGIELFRHSRCRYLKQKENEVS